MSYGTGAIMAVPAHDERDHEFAVKFNLPIIQVVESLHSAQGLREDDTAPAAFTGEGHAINSDFLDGLPTAEAKAKMIDWLEEQRLGARRVQYKLRDWLFSRQRYWGEPFPVVWKGDQHEVIPESELPLTLPEFDDYKPTAEGNAPLAKATEWVNLPDGRARETNTMPQWAGSCWYYLRYCDPKNPNALIDPAVEKYWMGDQGRRSLRRRRGARRAAPALRALLAQGAFRPRRRLHARSRSTSWSTRASSSARTDRRCPSRGATSSTPTTWSPNTAPIRCASSRCSWARWSR